jgi:hypothetical protein
MELSAATQHPDGVAKLEAALQHGLDVLGHVDAALAEVAGVVLDVELADPVLPEPDDLLIDVVLLVERVADVVVDLQGRRTDLVEDPRVVLGGDGVLESEDYAGLLGFGPDIAKGVAGKLLPPS